MNTSELRLRLGELRAELLRLCRGYKRDWGRIAELEREILKIEAELERERPKPSESEIRRAELERALREARGRELAALRGLHSPFGSWDEYRARREAYENALRERENLERALEEGS